MQPLVLDTNVVLDVLESTVATQERTGPVSVNRSPSVEPRYPGDQYEAPDVPKELDPVPFPWAAFFASRRPVTPMRPR